MKFKDLNWQKKLFLKKNKHLHFDFEMIYSERCVEVSEWILCIEEQI